MKIISSISVISIIAIASACSTSTTPNTNKAATGNTAAANSVAGDTTAPAKLDDVPAAVKAAMPDGQTFSVQHKDLSDAQIASIEKDTSGKVADKDHHSYLAFSTANGAKTQIGAATIVKASGKEIIVVYGNKGGSPSIKEIKAEGMPAAFLSQFAGKGHDDDLLLGVDIKANGVSEDQAKSITEAIRIDVLAMQALYGQTHAH